MKSRGTPRDEEREREKRKNRKVYRRTFYILEDAAGRCRQRERRGATLE